MNRRERRAHEAMMRHPMFKRGVDVAQGRAPMPPDYIREWRLTGELLVEWLRQHPGQQPRFRFPGDRDVAPIASMKDIGHKLALNDDAHELVESWCALKELGGFDDYPTAMMARAALDAAGVPWETCALADVGLEPIGGGGGWQ